MQRLSPVVMVILASLAVAILLALLVPVRQPQCVGWTGYVPLGQPASPAVAALNETTSYICGDIPTRR
jgi:heme/copper-type cytochrome/quinol oxidase subunit 1